MEIGGDKFDWIIVILFIHQAPGDSFKEVIPNYILKIQMSCWF